MALNHESEYSLAQFGTDFAMDNYLLLPDCFGDIYMGQMFSAYVVALNDNYIETLHDVSMAVRLQTTNTSYELAKPQVSPGKSHNTIASLTIDNQIGIVVRHPVTEVGAHTLRVALQFKDPSTQEVKNIRKFYRFDVLNPLIIETNCYSAGGQYILEYVLYAWLPLSLLMYICFCTAL